MTATGSSRSQFVRWFAKSRKTVVLIFIAVAVCGSITVTPASAQAAPPATATPWAQEMSKYPGLMEEFGRLIERLQREVQLPAARDKSRLLPLLPDSTFVYVALPNYGEATHQSLAIFRDELAHSAVLRDWWQHTSSDTPQLESHLEQFYLVSQYLGDELVLSGSADNGKDPQGLLVAEVHKPGLKLFLQGLAKKLAADSKLNPRILDDAALATATDVRPTSQIVVLVRSDLVIAAPDVATLRAFTAKLDSKNHKLPSTPFGQRLLQAYEGGATWLGSIDLQRVLAQMPPPGPSEQVFRQTGFSDAKFLVWDHKNLEGESASEMELSFTGPRRAMASWLAAPGPMGSLDFVSPKALMVGTARLKNPAEIFDDLRGFSTSANPGAFANVEHMEESLKINLRNDVFRPLSGEVAFEVDPPLQQPPTWKIILGVKDPDRLQASFAALLAGTHLAEQRTDESGVTYHTLQIPSAAKPTEIDYAFSDGYLIVASSRNAAADAVQIHRSGQSLARSKPFLDALPPGRYAQTSALFYEDPVAFMARGMKTLFPGMQESSLLSGTQVPPVVIAGYGEQSALREMSRTRGVDASAVLVGAAIAIPNLLRARIAANEASAVASIRTANTAQVMYANAYPGKGFARDLATLGSGAAAMTTPSSTHAGFLEPTLGNPTCTATTWCQKSGFQFRMTATCRTSKCADYVVVATPISTATGTRNFCSTSDAVIRFKLGAPLTETIPASECRNWLPVQ